MVVTASNPSHGDGGEGSSRVSPLTITSKLPSDGEKFPRAVAKVAVAQICESAGFHSIQRSALETLADIAIRYLCHVGKASQLYANLAGRTESNALDAVSAIEDISGASFSEPHSLASSSVCVKELIRFVEYGDELPFAKPVPHFPACKTRKLTPSFAQLNEAPPEPHIPPWLPAFPDPQTYSTTSAENEDKRDAHLDNFEQTRRKQKEEQSRVTRRFRFCTSGASTSWDFSAPPNVNHTGSMGTSPPSASRFTEPELGKVDSEGLHNKGKSGKRPSVCTQNPFLAPPLPEGSKEVSDWFFDDLKPPSPAPGTKKIIAPPLLSVRDAFRPILQDASNKVQESSGTLNRGAMRDYGPVHTSLGFGNRAKDTVVVRFSIKKKDPKRERIQMDDDNEEEKKKCLSQYFSVDPDNDDDTG